MLFQTIKNILRIILILCKTSYKNNDIKELRQLEIKAYKNILTKKSCTKVVVLISYKIHPTKIMISKIAPTKNKSL